MDWSELAGILRARWVAFALTFIAAASVGTVLWMHASGERELTCWVECRAGKLPDLGVNVGDAGIPAIAEEVRRAFESPSFRERAGGRAAALGGGASASDPLAGLDLVLADGNKRVGLRWRGEDPARGRDLLDAVVPILREALHEQFQAHLERIRRNISAALLEVEGALRRAQEGREALRARIGLPPGRDRYAEALRAIDAEAGPLEARIRAASDRIEEFEKEREAGATFASSLLPGIGEDLWLLGGRSRGGPFADLVSALLREAFDLELRLEKERRIKTEIHPDLRQIRSDLEENRRTLQTLLSSDPAEGETGGLVSAARSWWRRIRQASDLEGKALRASRRRAEVLLSENRDLRDALVRHRDAYEEVDAEIASLDRIRERLRGDRQALALYERANREAFAVVLPPLSSAALSLASVVKTPAHVLAMALIAALGVTWLLQAVDPRAVTSSGLGRIAGVPFVVRVPARSADPAADLQWRRAVELLEAGSDGPRALALFDADGGLEMGDLGLALARAAAAGRLSVLLAGCGPGTIDGWPGVAEIARGLLRDHIEIGRVAVRSPGCRVPIEAAFFGDRGSLEERILARRDGIDLLGAGDWTRSAGSASRDRLAEFLSRIRERGRYDLAILACPSIDEWPEGLSVASAADGALLAIQGGSTRLRGIGALRGALERVGCPIAGMIWVAGSAQRSRARADAERAA